MARIIAERLTGVPQDSYVNEAMAWGTATEAQARSAYSFMADVDVVEVGIIRHPTIAGAHASPDGLVGADGLVEIKAPQTATHIDTLLSGKVSDRYVQQMQWQMACTGRAWCDFVSFDPRMPGDLQLFIRRFERDDERIADLEDAVRLFIIETQAKIVKLTALRNAA
jgi:putative phage-type endonuclease